MQRFIPDFAELTALLIDLQKGNMQYVWTPDQEKAFQEVKSFLPISTLLNSPRGDASHVTLSDASSRGGGSALLQTQEGTAVILKSAAKKFPDVQSKRDTRNREGFATKWALPQFSTDVGTIRTFLLTNYGSLTCMKASIMVHVQRWLLRLSQFHLKIHHSHGKLALLADWIDGSLPQKGGWKG